MFVRNIGGDPDDEAIVQATISMAHNLNRGVVAEGVELEEHLNFCATTVCEELQGYLFCRPLSAVSFENMLVERGLPYGLAAPAEPATWGFRPTPAAELFPCDGVTGLPA